MTEQLQNCPITHEPHKFAIYVDREFPDRDHWNIVRIIKCSYCDYEKQRIRGLPIRWTLEDYIHFEQLMGWIPR